MKEFYAGDIFDRNDVMYCYEPSTITACTADGVAITAFNDDLATRAAVNYTDDTIAAINSVSVGGTSYTLNDNRFDILEKKFQALEDSLGQIMTVECKASKKGGSILKMDFKNGLKTAAKKRLSICDLKTIKGTI